MFRYDKCTIKRPRFEKIKNEVVWGEPETIYTDIPCHLSVKSISPTVQSQSTAKVMYDYTLFVDSFRGVVIKPNDIVEVTTFSGKFHELRAGESQVYLLTIQTHCEVNKIV